MHKQINNLLNLSQLSTEPEMYGMRRLHRWFDCTPILTIILDLLYCDHLWNERHGDTINMGHGYTQYHVLGEEPFAITIMFDGLLLTIPIFFFSQETIPS